MRSDDAMTTTVCPMCAEEIAVNDMICPHCGSTTGVRPVAIASPSGPENAATPTCPMCSEEISTSDVTCRHCGSATRFTTVGQLQAVVAGSSPVVQSAATNGGALNASKHTKLIAIIVGAALLVGVAIVVGMKMTGSSSPGAAPTAPTPSSIAATTLPPPVQNPEPPPSPVTATPPATTPLPIPTLRQSDVENLINAQTASLSTDNFAFNESFSTDAIAFFPHALAPLEGKAKSAGSLAFAGVAIKQPSNIKTSPVAVGIAGSIAWAATTWTLPLGGSNKVMPIRVTEVLRQGPTGLEVIAASFSVAPARGATGIAGPVPSLAGGVPAGDGPEAWLASPRELSTHLLDDAMDASQKDSMYLFGSDPAEKALGVEAVRRLLVAWKRIKLEFVGGVRVIDGDDYKVVLGFARWPGPKPTLFRVLGVFVRRTGASWQLATAHYSIAVPGEAQN